MLIMKQLLGLFVIVAVIFTFIIVWWFERSRKVHYQKISALRRILAELQHERNVINDKVSVIDLESMRIRTRFTTLCQQIIQVLKILVE